MAKNPDKRASQVDIDEFGDHELTGAPSIAVVLPGSHHARGASTSRRTDADVETLSGIPIYSKDELRVIPPAIGQRYAVRDSGGLRGPYEITWLQNGAYMGVALHDVPGFPYQWVEPKPMDPERIRAISERKKR